MGTNPNFPPKDAPPLEVSEAPSVPKNGVRSQPTEKPTGPGTGDTPFDPERFGSFTLPPDFLKEALSQPLPRTKEEDLAHDTLAPYRPGGAEYQKLVGGTANFGTRAHGPADGSTLDQKKGERTTKSRTLLVIAGLLILCFAIGGVVAKTLPNDEDKVTEPSAATDLDESATKSPQKGVNRHLPPQLRLPPEPTEPSEPSETEVKTAPPSTDASERPSVSPKTAPTHPKTSPPTASATAAEKTISPKVSSKPAESPDEIEKPPTKSTGLILAQPK